MNSKKNWQILFCFIFSLPIFVLNGQVTTVSVITPEKPVTIDPMIYGQMLEDCNDSIIYGGVVNLDGSERPHVTEMLKPLYMPIVRWPAGTYSHEYNWQNGIGPLNGRPTVPCQAWGGSDNHRFGTDEFLKWCKQVNTIPYINFNMGNKIKGGSLGDALNWIEYVNGSEKTTYGQKRIENGHSDPYNVKYWCIGNENYGPWGAHDKETAKEYSAKLNLWASTIKDLYPELILLGVGHTKKWNDTVLNKNGHLIDFLTQHYYITSRLKEDIFVNPENSIFAPVKVEKHLILISEKLKEVNSKLRRDNNPIRFSIDEWNNRRSVFDVEKDKYAFTRNDIRRQLDVAVTGGMLNVFIRQSPYVGMANYIFPVNGHGLIRTVGDSDAFLTPVYYLFEKYREVMIGSKMEIQIDGPSINPSDVTFALDGDAHEAKILDQMTYIDAAAVLTKEGNLNISLINRSPTKMQKVKIKVPEGYKVSHQWILSSDDIHDANTETVRDHLIPKTEELKKLSSINIKPCGLHIVHFRRE